MTVAPLSAWLPKAFWGPISCVVPSSISLGPGHTHAHPTWRSPRLHSQHAKATFLSFLPSVVSLTLSCPQGAPLLVFRAQRAGFNFPALSHSLLRLTLPQGPGSEKKEENLMRIPGMFLGAVSLSETKGLLLRGGGLPIHRCCCTTQGCLGAGEGKRQQRGRKALKASKGFPPLSV